MAKFNYKKLKQKSLELNQSSKAVPANSEEDSIDNVCTKYLSFLIGNKTVAIPLLSAQEVIEVPEFTEIPNSPHHIRGIINLRGEVITIADLSSLLGQTPIDEIELRKNCIVIVRVNGLRLGFLVDEAKGVIDLEIFSENLKTNSSLNSNYVENIAKNKSGEFVFTLNFQKLIESTQLG